jgi:hypothetical protein
MKKGEINSNQYEVLDWGVSLENGVSINEIKEQINKRYNSKL